VRGAAAFQGILNSGSEFVHVTVGSNGLANLPVVTEQIPIVLTPVAGTLRRKQKLPVDEENIFVLGHRSPGTIPVLDGIMFLQPFNNSLSGGHRQTSI